MCKGKAIIIEPEITKEENERRIADLAKFVAEIGIKMIKRGELIEGIHYTVEYK